MRRCQLVVVFRIRHRQITTPMRKILRHVAQNVDQLQTFAVSDSQANHFTFSRFGKTIPHRQISELGPELPHAAGHPPGIVLKLRIACQCHRARPLGSSKSLKIEPLPVNDGRKHLTHQASFGRRQTSQTNQTITHRFEQSPLSQIRHSIEYLHRPTRHPITHSHLTRKFIQAFKPLSNPKRQAVRQRVTGAREQIPQTRRTTHRRRQKSQAQIKRARHPLQQTPVARSTHRTHTLTLHPLPASPLPYRITDCHFRGNRLHRIP